MPWNTGIFARQYGSSGWANDKAAGTKIVASRHDVNDDDLATGINNCLTKDGQNAAAADLPMGGFKHTGVADATAVDNYATFKQVQNSTPTYLTGVAGTDTITAGASIAPAAYVAGQIFRFIPAGANTTTTPTLNVNGLGAKNITKNGTDALLVGDIKASTEHVVIYDGTRFQLLNPLAPLSAYATLDSTTVAGGDLLPIYDISATTNKAITVDNVRATVGGTFGTIWTSTSGTSNDWTIPSWARRITVIFNAVSLSGSSDILVQLGDSGGVETAGYVSTESRVTGLNTCAVVTSTAGFLTTLSNSARTLTGVMTVNQIDASSGLWIAGWNTQNSSPEAHSGAGSKTVSGPPVTTLRVTTANGTDTFDAGSVNVFVE